MAEPYYTDDTVTLYLGDCLDVLRELPDASVDSVVTDPPYGLGFMGKEWDDLPPGEPFARECLRVLKPGGHILAFGGSRTWHRLAAAVEDAGFEIRDSIAWLNGSGFPKSLDVSKAIDKAAGAERVGLGVVKGAATSRTESLGVFAPEYQATAPATPDAEKWQGWGTALKPAFEPIVVGRKPLSGTVAANVLAYGTGALNVDGCRVGEEGRVNNAGGVSSLQRVSRVDHGYRDTVTGSVGEAATVTGRWPANVVLDDSQAAELDAQSGIGESRRIDKPAAPTPNDRVAYSDFNGVRPARGHTDSGGASRFFPTFRYEAKAPASERPRYTRPKLRLRGDLTPAQVDHVRVRLVEAGVQVD